MKKVVAIVFIMMIITCSVASAEQDEIVDKINELIEIVEEIRDKVYEETEEYEITNCEIAETIVIIRGHLEALNAYGYFLITVAGPLIIIVSLGWLILRQFF